MEKPSVWLIKKIDINNPRFQEKYSKLSLLNQSTYTFLKIKKKYSKLNPYYKSMSIIDQTNSKRWHIYITLKFKDNFELKTIAPLDSGANLNRIKEDLIPF